ncbi:MAG: hypothetical protein A4E65_00076 [Syntrophorhabdus sp. PtaU1.Bin153]|nr:MAG: hypothetical protein A4E65_00076 [Syntrophorhabdus sp. PtaU1.Bin153]
MQAMKPLLAKETAFIALQDFFSRNPKPFVLFGTGTSCAIDQDFGMNKLSEYLLESMPRRNLNQNQKEEWDTVIQNLNNGQDLETAMNAVSNDVLTQSIVFCTANLLSSLDRKYGPMLLRGELTWPAISLFRRLVDGLGTSSSLDVATPNYDMLAEYAFEKERISYTTGFVGGICRRLDWRSAKQGMCYGVPAPKKTTIRYTSTEIPHIRLHKVHGSLNTFKVNNEIVENNGWAHCTPEGIERSMITPGTSKYERLHENRQELLGQYDEAIEAHNAFLFIGFGFNDHQLVTGAIKRKLKEQECNGLVITRDKNARIVSLLNECPNLWLICKSQRGPSNETEVTNANYSEPLYISDVAMWEPNQFTKTILEGD